MLSLSYLPKSRRKGKRSDILEEKRNYTFVPNSCHGKTEMFKPISRLGRETVFLTIFVLGIFFKSVHTCDVDGCWDESQVAYQTLSQGAAGTGSNKDTDIRCTSLRTYMHCLDNLHGCKGNIKFHSVKKVVRNQMNHYRCDPNLEIWTGTPITLLPPDELCTYHGTKVYRHCGLFGDPHIRTFDNKFQTCKVQGAWPLVDNDHLTVQVTNEVVSRSLSATATTKLTVLIKENRDCASNGYILYQADSYMLPSSFNDGQTKYGKSHSVSLVEIDPGRHVEITMKYIDTRIVIRLVGNYLTFLIRMPEQLLPVNSTNKNNIELCVRGCPKSEIIDYKKFLALKEKQVSDSDVNMSRKEAEELCRSANLVDFYFDSCVFDLLTTGNDTFRYSALSALQDVLKSDPDFHKNSENRTKLTIYDEMYAGAQSVRTSYLNLLTVFVLTLVSIFNSHLNRT
ncbi:repulsive guidance molecule A-like isoform X2 [Mercenaria mercenaria]|uniref:repulsive guidance molecule A-like isoform X2 n=1 Tax=Mercenaria mercenaria TaxID=6596 RepID=UPI00234E6181|nr:repulsive guidance molecule A-like isoform X2 [Mercenaria mercenaria]